MNLFACAIKVGTTTKSLVVPRRSTLGVVSFVDRGQIVALASCLVGTVTDVGVLIMNKGGGLQCWDGIWGVPIRCASASESLLMSVCWI